jgi:pimeloyl-ACP methyl ester carboxylesterase
MAETSIPSIGDLHDDQLVALLRSGAHAALLTAYFGESEYRELAQLAKLAVTRRNPRGRRVFVLPGIMGSRLGLVARRKYSLLWLHPTAVANGSLLQLAMPSPRALRAVGVMLPGYLKLRLRLEVAGFRPVFCPFDWRRDVDHLAREFARLIERSGERKALVVGHSMGGVIARAALAYDKRRIAKLIQLGAPNDGSFAPLQALRAVYPTVRKIASLDRDHSAEHLARTVFHTLPGIYQMLPSAGNAAEPDLFDPRGWPADELAPNPKLLARARRIRAQLPAANRIGHAAGARLPIRVSRRRRWHSPARARTLDRCRNVVREREPWSADEERSRARSRRRDIEDRRHAPPAHDCSEGRRGRIQNRHGRSTARLRGAQSAVGHPLARQSAADPRPGALTGIPCAGRLTLLR